MFSPNHRPPDELCDLIFAHEILRRLGFLPGQIFATHHPGRVCVTLMARQNYTWEIRTTRLSFEEFTRLWPEVVEAWNAPPAHRGLWGFNESEIKVFGTNVALELYEEGELEVVRGQGFVPAGCRASGRPRALA